MMIIAQLLQTRDWDQPWDWPPWDQFFVEIIVPVPNLVCSYNMKYIDQSDMIEFRPAESTSSTVWCQIYLGFQTKSRTDLTLAPEGIEDMKVLNGLGVGAVQDTLSETLNVNHRLSHMIYQWKIMKNIKHVIQQTINQWALICMTSWYTTRQHCLCMCSYTPFVKSNHFGFHYDVSNKTKVPDSYPG